MIKLNTVSRRINGKGLAEPSYVIFGYLRHEVHVVASRRQEALYPAQTAMYELRKWMVKQLLQLRWQ